MKNTLVKIKINNSENFRQFSDLFSMNNFAQYTNVQFSKGVVHVTHIEKLNNTYCAITHKNAE